MYKKLTIILSATAILCASCSKTEQREVSHWPDGSPKLVKTIKTAGDKETLVGERAYYENGNLHYEKHYKNDGETPTGKWIYNYRSGKQFAIGDFDKGAQSGDDWTILDTLGNPYMEGEFDSVKVAELGDGETPASVVYCKDSVRTLVQFYSDGSLRCKGQTVNGKRHGVWTFYYSNGMVQTEAHFSEGKENGMYTVYRETGIPYYRGAYINGQRSGVWEFYDEQANLVQTKNF